LFGDRCRFKPNFEKITQIERKKTMRNLKCVFIIIAGISLTLGSCSEKIPTTSPTESAITESIYASGTIKSENQYSVFSKVNGIVEQVYVKAGDYVIKGSPILSIYNEAQRLTNENAKLNAEYYNFNSNVKQLNELKNQIEIAKLKAQNDSAQFERQKKLRASNTGTDVEYEASQLKFQASEANYQTAITNYEEFKRKLDFNSSQAQRNVEISGLAAKDYTVYSEIEGIVYTINKEKGEMINIQSELAVIGDPKLFILEMQVDERDILKINLDQRVVITMESYGDQTFEAKITKIYPFMDTKSKTFKLEATFIKPPGTLYPNMNFEANIVVNEKSKTLLIPRKYLIDDGFVIRENGDTIPVVTGLKNYQQVEILSGLTITDKIRLPEE
jgi:multidrug efflux pump subunit AcrA (membrane-fusion protein)